MLFIILFLLTNIKSIKKKQGCLSAFFLIFYSIFRFVCEFFREPDAHLAYVVAETGLSRGQWLTLPMIAIGLAVIVYSLTRQPAPATPSEPRAA